MIIDGNRIAAEIQEELKREIAGLKGRSPCLAVLLVGDNPASKIYINRKAKACEQVGIVSKKLHLQADVSEGELLKEISNLNQDPNVDGILVQLPLPQQIDSSKVISAIDPEKDVDGFHPINVGKLLIGDRDGFLPCTPYGIQQLLVRMGIKTAGMKALIIGRSNIVGKPMAALLMQNVPGGNATVTVAHSFTKNLKELSLESDLIIVAVGRARSLTADMVKEGAIVVDVGINKVEDPSSPGGSRIVGDVDYEDVKKKCSYITPVPGGVGPMTIAMLLTNTLKSYKQKTR